MSKKADLMCSAHSRLRDRFLFRALVLDVALLISSAFIAAHTFGSERIREVISPFGVSYDVSLSVFGLIVFIVSLVQFRVSWKEKAGAHAKSFSMYAEVKHEIGKLLATKRLNAKKSAEIQTMYELAGEAGSVIPEAEFLRQKQKHKLKVFVSQYLDKHPGASVTLVKAKVFLRDNFGWNVLAD